VPLSSSDSHPATPSQPRTLTLNLSLLEHNDDARTQRNTGAEYSQQQQLQLQMQRQQQEQQQQLQMKQQQQHPPQSSPTNIQPFVPTLSFDDDHMSNSPSHFQPHRGVGAMPGRFSPASPINSALTASRKQRADSPHSPAPFLPPLYSIPKEPGSAGGRRNAGGGGEIQSPMSPTSPAGFGHQRSGSADLMSRPEARYPGQQLQPLQQHPHHQQSHHGTTPPRHRHVNSTSVLTVDGTSASSSTATTPTLRHLPPLQTQSQSQSQTGSPAIFPILTPSSTKALDTIDQLMDGTLNPNVGMVGGVPRRGREGTPRAGTPMMRVASFGLTGPTNVGGGSNMHGNTVISPAVARLRMAHIGAGCMADSSGASSPHSRRMASIGVMSTDGMSSSASTTECSMTMDESDGGGDMIDRTRASSLSTNTSSPSNYAQVAPAPAASGSSPAAAAWAPQMPSRRLGALRTTSFGTREAAGGGGLPSPMRGISGAQQYQPPQQFTFQYHPHPPPSPSHSIHQQRTFDFRSPSPSPSPTLPSPHGNTMMLSSPNNHTSRARPLPPHMDSPSSMHQMRGMHIVSPQGQTTTTSPPHSQITMLPSPSARSHVSARGNAPMQTQ